MIINWFKLNRLLDFKKDEVRDTSWFQKQILKKKYQNKKQGRLYNNQAKMNRSHVKISVS